MANWVKVRTRVHQNADWSGERQVSAERAERDQHEYGSGRLGVLVLIVSGPAGDPDQHSRATNKNRTSSRNCGTVFPWFLEVYRPQDGDIRGAAKSGWKLHQSKSGSVRRGLAAWSRHPNTTRLDTESNCGWASAQPERSVPSWLLNEIGVPVPEFFVAAYGIN